MTLCAHFGTCGGCAFQDLSDDAYRAMKRNEVQRALAQNDLHDAVVEDVVEARPLTRRRATFKVEKNSGKTELGFYAAKSHTIVDMRECHVLMPALTVLALGLREMMAGLLHDGEKTEMHVTDTDTGFDIVLRWKRLDTLKLTGDLARWAGKLNIARITGNNETLIELRAPAVRFGKAIVKIPPDAFLQPTKDGEAALQSRVLTAVKGAKAVADLFAGCGTFALLLAQQARVHAVEQDGRMLNALAAAARTAQGLKPVTTEKRDLFKLPLGGIDLAKFDAVVLDPPRSGAAAQAKTLAASKVARIAYVSCNAATFARDARLLVEGGYRMGAVTPVDQFLWSSHIELVTMFERAGRGKN